MREDSIGKIGDSYNRTFNRPNGASSGNTSTALSKMFLVAFLSVIQIAFFGCPPDHVQSFSYQQLQSATKCFKASRLLGRGSFGSVYKGVLQDGSVVAVKRLINNPTEHLLMEISHMARILHPNLLRLRGWCYDCGEKILVYEFMEKRSLDRFLNDQSQILSLAHRYGILKGVASAIQFLHDRGLLHLDVKPGNILLDSDFNPKLGDFGCLQTASEAEDRRPGKIGTPGYMAPELATRPPSTKSDVFSFGVLVLEVISGRRDPLRRLNQNQPTAGSNSKWPLLLEAVDSEIESCEQAKVSRLIELGLLCTDLDPEKRPSMELCCRILGKMDLDDGSASPPRRTVCCLF